jgi:carboxymethylenebutenolidase
MTPNYLDSILKPGDPRLKSEFISYDSSKGGGKSKDFYRNPMEPKATRVWYMKTAVESVY